MAAKAGRLQIQLEMEVAQLRRDLASTSAEFKRATGQWKTNLDEFARGFKTAFVTGAVVAGIAAVSNAMSGLFQKFDDIADGSKRIGTSAESFQKLEYAATQSGVSMDAVEGAIGRMQRALGEIGEGRGKTAAEALDALGLSAEKLRGLSPDEQFLKIAGALKQVQDQSQQAALGAELFGRGVRQLKPLINEGEQAIRDLMQAASDMGLVLSNKVVAAGDAFNDQMAVLKALGVSAISDFFEPILPLLTALANNLTDAGEAGSTAAGGIDKSKSAIQTLGEVAANTIGAVAQLTNVLSAIGKSAVEIVGDSQEALMAGDWAAAFDSDLSRARATLKKFSDEATRANRAIIFSRVSATVSSTEQLTPGQAPGTADADEETATDRKTEAVRRNTAAKRENLDVDRETARAAQERRDQDEAIAKVMLDIEQAQRQLAGATEEQVRLWRLGVEGADAYTSTMSDMNAQLDTLREAVRSDAEGKKALEAANIELEASQMRLAGATEDQVQSFLDAARGLSEYETAARKASAQADENNTRAQARAQEAQDITYTVGQGISDVFTSLSEGSDAATAALVRLVAQLLTAIATAQILKAFNLTGVGGYARGGVFDAAGVHAFAQGGIVRSATPFTFGGGQYGVMGEAGPEAIMPLQRGADGKLGVAGGGSQVQIFNYAGAQVSAEQEGDRLRVVVDRVRSALSADVARGGNVFASSFERAYGVRR